MPSFIPAAAYIFRRLVCIATHVWLYLFYTPSFPPQVPSPLTGYGNGLLYALSPCAFLTRCRQRYGPVYRVSLGPWRLVVVSSGDAIPSVFSAPLQLLSSNILHQRIFHVIAGVKTNYVRLYEITIRNIYPLLDSSLSPHSLGQTTQAFGLVLLSQVMALTRDRSGPISLTQLTNEPLFTATNLILFGEAFSTDTYRDFRVLDKSAPYRFCGTLLWRWSSYTARTRLLKELRDYLQQGGRDTHFFRGFMKVLEDNKVQPSEGAQLVLTFLWTLHGNVLNNSFFLLSFLLGDPSGFARVLAEIDSAVEKFGSLERLLQASPSELDDPSFRLLTSAIMETLRFTALHDGMCQATCDFDLKLGDSEGMRVSVKKGEFVFGDVHSAHMDAVAFPNPETFVVDRFAQHPYRRKHLQTEGYSFYSLGGGRHLCKGRWLAIYEIKVLMIVLLHTFNFSLAVHDSTGWRRPRVHPRSVGVVHTEDDVFVQLSPRQMDGV